MMWLFETSMILILLLIQAVLIFSLTYISLMALRAPILLGVSLVAHADTVSKLWYERFGHVNYRYLQQMSTQELVI